MVRESIIIIITTIISNKIIKYNSDIGEYLEFVGLVFALVPNKFNV